METKIAIQNMVASASFKQPVDLNAIVMAFPEAEYRPDRRQEWWGAEGTNPLREELLTRCLEHSLHWSKRILTRQYFKGRARLPKFSHKALPILSARQGKLRGSDIAIK